MHGVRPTSTEAMRVKICVEAEQPFPCQKAGGEVRQGFHQSPARLGGESQSLPRPACLLSVKIPLRRHSSLIRVFGA